MTMFLDDYPECCTALCLGGFGGESPESYKDDGWDYVESVKDIIDYCNKKIPLTKKDGFGLVVAITTDVQKYANEALEKLGFYHHEADKTRNKDTGKLHMWFMPTHEFTPVKI